jgi:UDP-N-acetylmuramoylalanine--D-glutamate ligase
VKIKDLKNKKIAILGYWVEWKSTHKFLNKLNLNDITILDKSTNIDYLNNLDNFDIIFKSPWISPYNNPELLKVKNKLISQAEILADNFDWKIIWITWTKGKSTISTLLYEILKELWHNVKLVWNIWNPVLDEIDIINWEKLDFVVYELSSYMLEWLNLNIEIWLLNNIYDCHLDWHNWRENYENAKINIFKNSEYKLAWIELKEILKDKFDNIEYFWDDLEKYWIYENEICIKWKHNYKNVSGILNIIKIIEPDFDLLRVKKVLSEFTGLEHRQENIWKYKWITFINDAIAVTQESTIAAIETYWKEIWTIFLWWVSTWVDYTKLVIALDKYNIKNIVLFPDSGSEIKKCFWNYKPNILETKSMEEAVKFWFKNTKKWEYCILSSAAQSFSLWKNFIEKWNLFKEFVKKYGE